MDAYRVVEVSLPEGRTVLVRALDDGDGTPAQGAEEAGFGDRFDLDDVVESIRGIATSLNHAIESAAPTSASVELGFEVAVKSGRLTALLVEGSGTASLKVTLTWERPKPAPAPAPG
jgi:hypothetical protein